MVFQSVKKIKELLPDVKHVIMFYNDGIVYNSTFENDINIPKLGSNLSKIINHFKQIYEICEFEKEPYKKIIYETKNLVIGFLKLGENSNLALVIDKLEEKDIKFKPIRRCLNHIERLIDMDKVDLDKKKLDLKRMELEKLKDDLKNKHEKIEKIEADIKNLESIFEKKRINLDSVKKEVEKITDIKGNRESCLKIRKEELKNLDEESVEIEKIEIKKEEEDFTNFCKEVEEKIQDLKNIENQFEQDDAEKSKMQDRVKSIQDECENIKTTVTEKIDALAKLEEEISIKEKEKLEDKL